MARALLMLTVETFDFLDPVVVQFQDAKEPQCRQSSDGFYGVVAEVELLKTSMVG